ncbi:phosphoglycolate phosphatase [Eubacterium aggregans]|uniref:Phosphoglycolate phosphatase n=1 Tax=Eubacterium aggregans TaxID=81409 RepID=A0A1H3YZC6_9FIRM|nr:HAD hydrolase-like protein [Eubacterium aggregans]SEA16432.1 phosphoglycolate phosphatase [Eubacterium aggregans]
MRYDCILFDLDGTLLDSREGVWRSFEYALEQLGHPEPIITNPAPIIGPPIEEVLGDHFGFGPEDVVRGYAYYQEAYVEKGLMYGDPFFHGTEEAIARLLNLGCTVGVCTNKGEKSARAIVENAGIGLTAEDVYGYAPEKGRSVKSDIIKSFLLDKGLTEPGDWSTALMVGDRYTDIEGAKDVGIDSVGVLWGNGTTEEFVAAGATAVVDSYGALLQWIKGD